MQYEPTETMTASASVRPGQVQTRQNPSMEKNGEGTQSLIPNQKNYYQLIPSEKGKNQFSPVW